MEGKKFNSVTKVTTVNSNQSLLLTDQNGNVTSIGMDALKADLSLGSHTWCGRVWNTANATPKAAMVVGDLDVLRELPLTLGLGAYLVKNDHSRRKLDATDHYKYATGEAAKLDGSQGHYQWGWGREFYFVTKDVGGLHYEMIGLKPIPGEYNYKIPIGSISASGFATIERSTGRLVSFINTGSDYRGGNNDASLDGTNRTLCGKPASSQTTEYFRAAARKNGKGWLCTTMRHTTIIAALIGVIMGTHYDQDAVNTAKDSNGLYRAVSVQAPQTSTGIPGALTTPTAHSSPCPQASSWATAWARLPTQSKMTQAPRSTQPRSPASSVSSTHRAATSGA